MGERDIDFSEHDDADDGFEVFAGYTVYEELGRGGMATVHRAELVGPGGAAKDVALKRMLPQTDPDAAALFKERFLSEMANAAKLSHPNVVQILNFGEFEGTYYIVMELVRGMDLRSLMKALRRLATGKQKYHPRNHPRAHELLRRYASLFANRRLPEHLAAYIGLQSAQAFAYAHETTVHRDESEDNTMVTVEGQVKLNDWGISKAKRAGESFVTKTGKAYGKPLFMAPEQFRGQPLDGRADLYSLGIVLFRLLSGGRHPCDKPDAANDDDIAKAFRAAMRDRPPIAELIPHASPAMHQLLDSELQEGRWGLIEPDPERRPPSAAAILRPLKEIVGDVYEAGEELGQLVRLAYYGDPKTIPDRRAIRRAMAAAPTPSHPGSGDVAVSQVMTKREGAPRSDSRSEVTERSPSPTEPQPMPATAPLPAESHPAATSAPVASGRSKPLILAIAGLSVLVAGLLAFTVAFFVGNGDGHGVSNPTTTSDGPAVTGAAAQQPQTPIDVAPSDRTEAPRDEPARDAPAAAETVVAEHAPAPVPSESETANTEEAPASAVAARGTLILTAAPIGELFVDGRHAGTGSVRVRVRPGSHRIGVGPRGSRQPTRSETVQVSAGGTVQRILRP